MYIYLNKRKIINARYGRAAGMEVENWSGISLNLNFLRKNFWKKIGRVVSEILLNEYLLCRLCLSVLFMINYYSTSQLQKWHFFENPILQLIWKGKIPSDKTHGTQNRNVGKKIFFKELSHFTYGYTRVIVSLNE